MGGESWGLDNTMVTARRKSPRPEDRPRSAESGPPVIGGEPEQPVQTGMNSTSVPDAGKQKEAD